MIAACIGLLALGLYLMSQVTTPGELTLTAGILVGVGLSGTSFGVILAGISRGVREHRRSLFLGIGSAGGASGQFFMVPLGQAFLSSYGWMITLLLRAAMVIATLPMAIALTGKRSSAQARAASLAAVEQPLGQALHEAGNHRSYIYLTTGFSSAASSSPSSPPICRPSSSMTASPPPWRPPPWR